MTVNLIPITLTYVIILGCNVIIKGSTYSEGHKKGCIGEENKYGK